MCTPLTCTPSTEHSPPPKTCAGAYCGRKPCVPPRHALNFKLRLCDSQSKTPLKKIQTMCFSQVFMRLLRFVTFLIFKNFQKKCQLNFILNCNSATPFKKFWCLLNGSCPIHNGSPETYILSEFSLTRVYNSKIEIEIEIGDEKVSFQKENIYISCLIIQSF